jgi:hypothetical protein
MMMDRRTFILRTTLVATARAVANLLLLPSAAQSRAALQRPSPPQPAADGSDVNCVAFKIHGWDECDTIAKISSLSRGTNEPSADQVWIRINQSWRTAWR